MKWIDACRLVVTVLTTGAVGDKPPVVKLLPIDSRGGLSVDIGGTTVTFRKVQP